MVADGSAPLVVCLMGPTGTGKTQMALDLVQRFNAEIISVDSAQVYRHMDIGTAKPSAEVRRRVRHHLIDICDPWERYSAGRFRTDACSCMREIQARGVTPLLVGGTLLYFHVLWRGLASLPEANPAVRAQIEQRAEQVGWAALHRELGDIDPEAAARIRPSDQQRIQRALEVHRLTGQPISAMRRGTEPGGEFRFLRIALVPGDRSGLYGRLDSRLLEMVRQGLVGEVERLMRMPGMTTDLPSVRAVGYRQLWRYLQGELPLEEAIRQAQVATHRLAKRQMTWLRREPVDQMVDPLDRATFDVVRSTIESRGVAPRH